MLDIYLRRWFVHNHGEGEAHQADVYRCYNCGRLHTWKHIRSANLCCAGRLIPVNPTTWEKVKLLVLPWMV